MIDSLFHYRATVASVYDGDTITANIDLGFNITIREKIRLQGINTPEVRGSEREEGLRSRDALRAQIDGKEIYLKTEKDKKGKYGRYIGTILQEVDGELVNINQWLVSEGLAEEKDY
jgi:micrococcal nuclease